MIEMYIIQSNH